ncbi:Uncharacterised protein [Finegoldia magna]|uniref:Uncharacterized protein n=1 Tax=Finegoldia magna TaxID=1260 RepID=A0A6N3C174_FINMA
MISSPFVTTIFEPGTPVPVIVGSFAVTSLIFGFAEVSFTLVAVAVIVALSLLIAVPAGVDHVGFSYPSFAFTSGYLSAVNAVPSFTSYTLLFAMSFTPSPFVNVTLTYPSGVGASGFFVLSMISSSFATLIFAVALSVDLSG